MGNTTWTEGERGAARHKCAGRGLRALGLALAMLAVSACGDRVDPKAPRELPQEVADLLQAAGQNDLERAGQLLAQLDREALAADHGALVDRVDSQLRSAAGDQVGALQVLERALDSGALDPGEAQAARFDQAWLYGATGQPAQAVEKFRAWQESLGAEPSHAQLLIMSESYAAAHDCAGAAALIARVYEGMKPEEKIDVAAAIEVARPLCPSEQALAKYGDVSRWSLN